MYVGLGSINIQQALIGSWVIHVQMRIKYQWFLMDITVRICPYFCLFSLRVKEVEQVFEVLNVKTLLFKWSESSGTISIIGEMGNKYGRSSLCSSLMHFAANRYSSPLVVSGGWCSTVFMSWADNFLSLGSKMSAFLGQLTTTKYCHNIFLVTFSLKVYPTCVAAWNGVLPIALKVALLYRASPSVLINMLASPHFSLKF